MMLFGKEYRDETGDRAEEMYYHCHGPTYHYVHWLEKRLTAETAIREEADKIINSLNAPDALLKKHIRDSITDYLAKHTTQEEHT